MDKADGDAGVSVTGNRIERDFGAYEAWRRDVVDAIDAFGEWLKAEELGDLELEQRLDQVLFSLRDDRLYVAFVAEFSRGKSELINATFFSQMGRRILPSSAGRTTMCPTELLYDAGREPCIRLLPIDTRETAKTVSEYKRRDEHWEHLALDMADAEQFAETLSAITEVKAVTQARAKALGLPMAADEDDGAAQVRRDDGLVEIPRWRHAIINLPHPLLERGLVILDTPGLNAIGAEPELTLNMLAGSQAVVFLLAADVGVTQSDMALWRDHIAEGTAHASRETRLVVLNKIDLLSDDLLQPTELERNIAHQVRDAAETLGVPDTRVFPVSAYRALLGRIRGDAELVDSSGIETLEEAIANVLIPSRRDILRQGAGSEMQEIFACARAVLEKRRGDLIEHATELQGLNTKNVQVMEDLIAKIQADRERLENNVQRLQATRAIFTRQRRCMFDHLKCANFDRVTAETKRDMSTSLTTGGLRAQMFRFFRTAIESMDAAAEQSSEIYDLTRGVQRKLKEEHGLAVVKVPRFSARRYQLELRRLEAAYDRYLRGLSMIVTGQDLVITRFYDSVVANARQIFEQAERDARAWLKTVLAPVESGVKQHRHQLSRRLDSIKRIHEANDSLEEQLSELRGLEEEVGLELERMSALAGRVERCLQAQRQSLDAGFVTSPESESGAELVRA